MWHNDFITRCLQSSTTINDAAGYGVTILPAIHWPGDIYWRCIGIHHLTGLENVGKRNFYLDALDSQGQRVNGTKITWGWEGMTPDQIQRTRPVVIDKPAYEPGSNISLDAGQVVWAQVAGALSDRVIGVHTGHDDEPGGNTRFHHSFYAVWQLTKATGQQPDPDPEPPAYEPLSRFTVWRYYKNAGWTPAWTGDDLAVAFTKYVDHTVEAGPAGHVYLMVRL